MTSVDDDEEAGQHGPGGWAALAADLRDLQETGRWLPGPATTLEVTGRTGLEVDHERLIAWLLNPRAAHDLGPAVLAAILERSDAASASPEDVSRARVRTQVVGASSRPDIIVTMPGQAVVIELKINAGEGPGQTARQADDHAAAPGAIFVFLTLRGRGPGDGRFRHLPLRDFAADLRRVLDAARTPLSPAAATGRATAQGYLATLERMLGMDSANQDAARFWLLHRESLAEAQAAARKLLAHLPGRACDALGLLDAGLGDDAVVCQVEEDGEHAVVLARQKWLLPDGTPGLGAGLGQSLTPDPDKNLHRPFWGIYAADLGLHPALREACALDGKSWNKWAWWAYLNLDLATEHNDALTQYADEAARQVRLILQENPDALDRIWKTGTAGQ